MTRIFDALRKARVLGPAPAAGPAPAPPALVPAVPRPVPPGAVALAAEAAPAVPALPPPVLVTLPALPPMSDDVLREMSTLRVHLESALTERVPRTVMMVSAQGGEGTTTVATQLATALARDSALRVLLVDAHGRRPALSRWIATGSPRRIAFSLIRRPVAPVPDPVAERLKVLTLPETLWSPAGVPAALLRRLMESVEAGFDWIVIDGPPVLESPDAGSLGCVADGVVMVVQAGRTKRPVLARSVELLRKAGARVLGTVLNRRRLEIPGFIYRRI